MATKQQEGPQREPSVIEIAQRRQRAVGRVFRVVAKLEEQDQLPVLQAAIRLCQQIRDAPVLDLEI